MFHESLRQSSVRPHTIFTTVSCSKTLILLNAWSSFTLPKVIRPLLENASTSARSHSLLHLSFPSHYTKSFNLPVALSPHAIVSRWGWLGQCHRENWAVCWCSLSNKCPISFPIIWWASSISLADLRLGFKVNLAGRHLVKTKAS